MGKYETIHANAEKTFSDFISEIKRGTVENAIELAHQITVKQEIVYLLSDEAFLSRFSVETLDEMANFPYLLDWLYEDWLHSDYSLLNEVKPSIEFTLSTRTLPAQNTNLFD